jgi:hypothetical protein
MSCKQTVTAAVSKRTRVVKVTAVKDSKPAAAFAAAAAAVLLASSPALAAPLSPLNPAAELAAGPASKVKQAAKGAKDISGQGALAPDVEGQVRAGGAGKPGAAANPRRTFVAANKADQESAMDKYPVSEVNWRR